MAALGLLPLLSCPALDMVEPVMVCVVSTPLGGGKSAASAGLGVLKLGGEVRCDGEQGGEVAGSAGPRKRST